MPFDGKTYDPMFDKERLKSQLGRVFNCMIDGKWRTLEEIQIDIYSKVQHHESEASISARLRDLRKQKFGDYIVDRRRRGDAKKGIFEYQLRKRKQHQLYLLDCYERIENGKEENRCA